MSSRKSGTDPARTPLLAPESPPSARAPSMDSSWRRSGGIGSLGSLEEGVAQLSSMDVTSYRSSANPSERHPSSHMSSFSGPRHLDAQETQWHSSPAQTPTHSKSSRTSFPDLFAHRSTETYLADPSEQDLATLAHDVRVPMQASSPGAHHAKASTPWRFLSSPVRHNDDRSASSTRDGIPQSASSRGMRSLVDAQNRLMPDGLPAVSTRGSLAGDVGASTSDEGRMVAHDSGMMTQIHRKYRLWNEWIGADLLTGDDLLTRYPDDVLIYMMTFLTPRDVIAVSQTCRLLNALSSYSTIWKVFYFAQPGWYINQQPVQRHADLSLRSIVTSSSRADPSASFESPMSSRVTEWLNDSPETPAKQSLLQLVSSSSSMNSSKRTPASPLSRVVDITSDALLDWLTIYKERTELERRWSNGEPAHVTLLQVHDDAVYCCYMLGKKIVTGSRDQSIKFWDHEVGKGKDPVMVHHIPKAHRLSVLCMQIDPEDAKHDGLMVTGSSDANIAVWALRGFLHSDEEQSSRTQKLKYALRPKKPKQVAILTGHKAGVLDLFLSPDKTKIVSCSKDATIKIWNRNTLQLIHDFPFHSGPVNCLSVRPDGEMFVSASGDGTIMLWDLNKCELIRELYQGTPGLACIAYTSDELIYFGGSDRKFNALDIASGEIVKDLQGHHDLVRTLVIKPELQRLVSGSYDQDVRIWDLKNDQCVGALVDSHGGMVFCLASDATRIVSTSHDTTMAVQDFAVGLKHAALFA